MANDPFSSNIDSVSAPSRAPFTIAPSDTTELPVIPKALYVGTGGALTVRGIGAASDVTFRNVASGQVLDIRAQYVRATGSTAADIIGLV